MPSHLVCILKEEEHEEENDGGRGISANVLMGEECLGRLGLAFPSDGTRRILLPTYWAEVYV
jgi:hypothetical protein